MNKIGKNLYHVVTPDSTFTFTTRNAARNLLRSWAPSQTMLFVSPLTPTQRLKALTILETT